MPPPHIDLSDPYDGYAPMTQFFLEAFQCHGVKRGDGFAFYAGDIRVERPHPLCSSGGNLGNGRTRRAMYTDCIEQLRGTAGARQARFGQRPRWGHSPRQAVAADNSRRVRLRGDAPEKRRLRNKGSLSVPASPIDPDAVVRASSFHDSGNPGHAQALA